MSHTTLSSGRAKIMTNLLPAFLLRMKTVTSIGKYISDWVSGVNRKLNKILLFIVER